MADNFGSVLRRYRLMSGLTQEALAERAGLSRRGISDLERGVRRYPYAHTVERLVVALGVGNAERDELQAATRRMAATSLDDPEVSAVSSLAAPLTSFVGREAELEEVRRLLNSCRLLTLTGVGGVGKTRLALESARQQTARWQDGVRVVHLASVGTASLLPSAIAAALGLFLRGPADPALQLTGYLRAKQLLLVVDNLEHLLDGAILLTRLLNAAPGLSILTTSRERLNLHEEWVVVVNGLALPHQATEGVDESPAVRLFVERARQVQPTFALHENRAAVVEVCRAVEGLPLALELAATWLRVMPCAQVASEIRHGLDFLTAPVRNLPERHRSLRAVFDRSWSLLSDDEQRVLERLSVFRGGFDHEAAAVIADASLGLLAGLVDKSLVRAKADGRFDLHELIRQYLAGNLTSSGEFESASQRYFDYFAGLALQAEAALYGPDQEAWFDRLELEYHNLVQVMTWSLHERRAEAGLRLAVALEFFCELRMHFHDCHDLLGQLLTLEAGTHAPSRARALCTAAMLDNYFGDYDKSAARLQEGLALGRAAGDDVTVAWCLASIGWQIADSEDGAVMLDEALRLFRAIGHAWGISHVLRRLGWVRVRRGELEQAETLFKESLRLARGAQNKHAMAWSLLLYAAAIWLRTRDAEYPRKLWRESALLSRETHDLNSEGSVLLMLGQVAHAAGDYDQAAACYAEILALERERGAMDHQVGFAYPLVLAFAQLAVATDKRERAARLFGALPRIPEAEFLAAGFSTPGGLEAELDILRAQLGETAFNTLLAQGRDMSIEEALAYALED